MELPKLSLFIAPTREGAAPSSRRRPVIVIGPLRQSALAALLPRGRPSDPAAAARPRGCALGVIAPDDVSVVVGGGDLDKAVPEFGASDVLFGLLPAHITLEHDVAVIG